MQRPVLRETGASAKNKRPLSPLTSMMKPREDNSNGLELFQSLKSELGRNQEQENRKRHPNIRNSALEEELYAEREKNRLLELEINTLEVELAQTRKQLDTTLMKASQTLKMTQEEVRRMKGQEEQRRMELNQTKAEAQQYKQEFCMLESRITELRRVSKASFGFLVSCYEMISQLPERVELSEMAQEAAEFSFDEKRVQPTIVDKEDYIKGKMVKFLHSNSEILDDLGVHELLLKLVEPSQEEQQNSKQASRKRRRSPSKQKAGRRESASKQEVVAVKGDPNDTLQEPGLNKSWQSNSAGKNNSYNININLILNDESLISEANQSNSIVATTNLNASVQSNMLRGFDQELGYEKADQSDSQLVSDSLMYSVSERLRADDSLEICRARYDFTQQSAGDIDLKRGDIIQILGKSPTGWWTGTNTRTGECGQFPSNFVEVVS